MNLSFNEFRLCLPGLSALTAQSHFDIAQRVTSDRRDITDRREIAMMRRLDRRGVIQFIDAAEAANAACPISRGALLLGTMSAGAIILGLQTAVVIFIGLLMGLKIGRAHV